MIASTLLGGVQDNFMDTILVNIGITQETRQRRKPEEPTQGARPGNAGTKIVQSSKPDKATQEAAPGDARSQTRQRRKLDKHFSTAKVPIYTPKVKCCSTENQQAVSAARYACA